MCVIMAAVELHVNFWKVVESAGSSAFFVSRYREIPNYCFIFEILCTTFVLTSGRERADMLRKRARGIVG